MGRQPKPSHAIGLGGVSGFVWYHKTSSEGGFTRAPGRLGERGGGREEGNLIAAPDAL